MDFVLEARWESLLFWCLTATWSVEPWVLRSPLTRRRSRRGALEFGLICAAMIGALLLCAAAHRYGLGVSQRATVVLRWLGLAIFGAGVGLRFWAGSTLGRCFTRDLAIEPGQELVTWGPYRWVRHPLYAALLLITGGLGLLFGAALPALCGVLVVAASLTPRIRREERLLECFFGSRYRDWAKRRARLVPPLI